MSSITTFSFENDVRFDKCSTAVVEMTKINLLTEKQKNKATVRKVYAELSIEWKNAA